MSVSEDFQLNKNNNTRIEYLFTTIFMAVRHVLDIEFKFNL